ncbi:MAG TPA: histidine phosphatase family protein [Candidatus Saccharimonadales bacterium]|nr:histidine phosphatase family protein [Candidatus Saccharimonadales bacterium]
MKRLYFMRHALSAMNVQGIRDGRTQTPLTAEGCRQAKKAGREAKKYHIDTIVCSPLPRTRETAAIVAKEIGFDEKKIHYNSLLIEREFGSFDGQPYKPDVNFDGFSDVETFDEVTKRAAMALDWIKTLGGTNVLVVSHGSLGRAMRGLLVPGADPKVSLQNAKIEQWL